MLAANVTIIVNSIPTVPQCSLAAVNISPANLHPPIHPLLRFFCVTASTPASSTLHLQGATVDNIRLYHHRFTK